MRNSPGLVTRMEVIALLAVVHAVTLVVGLQAELARRWNALRRSGDQGVESVEIAIGIALGLAVALLLWAAYKALVQKYVNQTQ